MLSIRLLKSFLLLLLLRRYLNLFSIILNEKKIPPNLLRFVLYWSVYTYIVYIGVQSEEKVFLYIINLLNTLCCHLTSFCISSISYNNIRLNVSTYFQYVLLHYRHFLGCFQPIKPFTDDFFLLFSTAYLTVISLVRKMEIPHFRCIIAWTHYLFI